MTITEPAMTPAEECRIAAATLRDPRPSSDRWVHYLPQRVAESLAVILDDAAEWFRDATLDEMDMGSTALAFARAVNGSASL